MDSEREKEGLGVKVNGFGVYMSVCIEVVSSFLLSSERQFTYIHTHSHTHTLAFSKESAPTSLYTQIQTHPARRE
jgi:hypothetical protein